MSIQNPLFPICLLQIVDHRQIWFSAFIEHLIPIQIHAYIFSDCAVQIHHLNELITICLGNRLSDCLQLCKIHFQLHIKGVHSLMNTFCHRRNRLCPELSADLSDKQPGPRTQYKYDSKNDQHFLFHKYNLFFHLSTTCASIHSISSSSCCPARSLCDVSVRISQIGNCI